MQSQDMIPDAAALAYCGMDLNTDANSEREQPGANGEAEQPEAHPATQLPDEHPESSEKPTYIDLELCIAVFDSYTTYNQEVIRKRSTPGSSADHASLPSVDNTTATPNDDALSDPESWINKGPEEHIAIWNTIDKRKLAGNAAPKRKNLIHYLATHPGSRVYFNQDGNRELNKKKRRRVARRREMAKRLSLEQVLREEMAKEANPVAVSFDFMTHDWIGYGLVPLPDPLYELEEICNSSMTIGERKKWELPSMEDIAAISMFQIMEVDHMEDEFLDDFPPLLPL